MTEDGRLPYNDAFHVNQTEALEKILHQTQKLVDGKLPDGDRLLRVSGVAGSGKSWLMCRAQEKIHKDFPNILLFRLCFVSDFENLKLDPSWERTISGQSPVELAPKVLCQLLRWTIEARGAAALWVEESIDPSDLITRLGAELTDTKKPCVLLVDGLDELPASPDPDALPGVVRLLADFVLIPLIQRKDVFVVLTARNPPADGIATDLYRPELSQYTDQDIVLEPFTEEDAKAQLDKAGEKPEITGVRSLAEEVAALIIAMSGGYAYPTIALAQLLNSAATGWDDPGQAAEVVAKSFLPKESQELLPYFYALCVLYEFDLWRLQEMCKAYNRGHIPATEYDSYAGASEVLRKLIATRLIASPDLVGNGHVMDAALRSLLHVALYETDHDAWWSLHTAAETLYTAWSEKYPRKADRWKAEAAYHHACLANNTPLP